MNNDSYTEVIDQVITHGVNKGILHLYSENERLLNNEIKLKGRTVVNFGSCSYLGLEHDLRLKDGARNAIELYGTQFSSSRAYVSLGLYEQLEAYFNNIFNGYCIVTPTTTLGHFANLPVLISNKDAVVIDQQAHSSIHMALSLLKSNGVYTEIIRHNRLDLLEERIKHLHNKHKKIWYLADGIYSMYGDGCDVAKLYELMDKYEQLYCYLDDAHGMSLYGENGKGYVLNKRSIHPKMIVATSLAKAFATGGAVMIYPDKETARKVRTCGGPLITSGPLQPANLGAAIECAKIHLSNEIYSMQDELHKKIKYTSDLLEEFKLPVISAGNAAIFFIGVGLPKLGYNVINRMLNNGYYMNLGVFPAVPMKNTGIRFTVTRLHTSEQIYNMVKTLAFEFPIALKEEGMKIEQIYKAFKMPFYHTSQVCDEKNTLTLHHYKSITEINKMDWNGLFMNMGNFDWDGLHVLEEAFTNNDKTENNWLFDYIIIKDQQDEIILATFITTALWKDDMLSSASVSSQVEQVRNQQPYFLTSIITSTGSLLTEGKHLFINKSSKQWKTALLMLLEQMHELQEKYKSNSIVIRDFHFQDKELTSFFLDNDFVKITMPDTNVINAINYKTTESFYESLSKRSQQHFREDIKKHVDKFDITIVENPSTEEIKSFYKLYLNVKINSLALNTFLLPENLFIKLAKNKSWECIVLKLKPEYHPANAHVCVIWCYKTESVYIPMIIGIDYTLNANYRIYRQALYQIILRALTLQKNKLFFGFGASVEKKKLGAKQIPTYAFMQYKDGHNLEILEGFTPASNSKNVGVL